MSETTSLWVSAAQPTIATARPTASTRRGRVDRVGEPALAALDRPTAATSRQRRPARGRAASRRPRARRRRAARAQRAGSTRRHVRPAARARSLKRTSAAKPAVSAHASAITMPTTSSAPNPRTIGTGESSSTRKPTAVASPALAIVGPPAAAASGAASRRSPLPSPRDLVEARLELDRVVDGEPDQHRQHGDRGHRQVAAGERQRAEGERRRRRARAPAAAAAAASGTRARASPPSAAAPRRAARRSTCAPRSPRPSTTTGHAGHHVLAALLRDERLVLRDRSISSIARLRSARSGRAAGGPGSAPALLLGNR